MTAVSAEGLESGCRETVFLTVAEGGGIQVVTPAASGVTFAIYRSTQDSAADSLRQAVITDPATTVILGEGLLGKPLETLYATKPLPGQQLVHHKGRLWVATGNVLWFTSEKSPHWMSPASGYYQFESTVRMLGVAEGGIYVGLYDRIYFLQGDNPADMTQRPVSSVGAVFNSGMEVPSDLFLGEKAFPSRQCAFWDTDGFLCFGKPGGIIMRPAKERYSTGEAATGNIAYRVYEGLRQLVSVMDVAQVGPMLASDVAINEIFANGVVLNP
jgi:hypothetical protein